MEIEYLQEFTKSFKRLCKKNRNLKRDFKEFGDSLAKEPKQGDHLGDGIYKIRVRNSSNNRCKRGGYRVITYYIDDNNILYFIKIFSKADTDSISKKEILDILEGERVVKR